MVFDDVWIDEDLASFYLFLFASSLRDNTMVRPLSLRPAFPSDVADAHAQADRNEEAEDELREAFVKTADKAQMVNAKQLVSILRYMGQNPTDAEAQDLIAKHGSGLSFPSLALSLSLSVCVTNTAACACARATPKGGTMTQQAFMGMMTAKNKDDGSEESVIEAFQVFDKDGKGE